jgi:hypothetical protein
MAWTYSREQRLSVIEMMRNGMSADQACCEIGARKATWRRWCETDPDFYAAWQSLPTNREKPETLTARNHTQQTLILGANTVAEQQRTERLERAREEGEYYREISLNYDRWCRLSEGFPIVRPKSLPPVK